LVLCLTLVLEFLALAVVLLAFLLGNHSRIPLLHLEVTAPRCAVEGCTALKDVVMLCE
jgi:hypothetical protein